jgi:hypothetical protein
MQKIEIHVKGQIDEHWSEWFEGLNITHTETGESVLSGVLADEAAVYGLITKIRDLGLNMVSIINTHHDNDSKEIRKEEQQNQMKNQKGGNKHGCGS